MATHAPIMGAPTRAPFMPAPPAAITRALSRFDRAQLAGFIAVAIDLLDLADGDTDLEETGLEDSFVQHPADGPGCPIAEPDHCAAHDDDPEKLIGDDKPGDPDDREDDDPAGDALDRGEGVDDHGRGLLPDRPLYALDQSAGPTNHAMADRDHRAREAGLVRSPTGGWTHPS